MNVIKGNVKKIITIMIRIFLQIILSFIFAFNYFYYWLITSDVPVCITSSEKITAIVLCLIEVFIAIISTYLTSVLRKKNIVLMLEEIFLLGLWLFAQNVNTLYQKAENNSLVIIINIISLLICLVMNAYTIIHSHCE